MTDSAYSIDDHFGGRNADMRDLYDRLMAEIDRFGSVTAEPKKTCIHVNRKSALAGVYVRNGYINLEFKTDYPIDSPRICKSEQISRSRYHHVVKLTGSVELDSELLTWLRDAHALSS